MDKDKSFVVYNCNHIAELSQMICLRLIRHRTEPSLLLMYDSGYGYIEELYKYGIFDRIVYYDQQYGVKATEDVESVITEYFDSLFKKNDIDISKASEIYTSCDYYNTFALFLSINNIRFNNVEMFPNQFKMVWRLRSKTVNSDICDTRISVELYDLQNKYGIIVGQGNFNPILYNREKVIEDNNIDFVEYFKLIKKDDRDILKKVFKIDFEFTHVQLLILSSWYYSTDNSIFEKNQYMYIYQLVADYCCDKDRPILVKQHPHDEFQLDQYFKGCIVLDRTLPFEFILLHDNIIIDKVFGSGSELISKLSEIMIDDYSMGWDLCNMGHLFHHFNIIGHLIEKMDFKKTVYTRVSYGDGEAKCLFNFFKRKYQVNYYSQMDEIESGSNIILNEFYLPVVDPKNNYFLLDYYDTKWIDYLRKTKMGLLKITISVIPGDNFAGNAIVNNMYLLSNNIVELNDESFELKNTSALVKVKYEVIQKPRAIDGEIRIKKVRKPTPLLAFDIGHQYLKGTCFKKNNRKAVHYFKIAAEENPWAVIEWYDVASVDKRIKVEKTLIDELEKFALADSRVTSSAMRRLGNAYRYGRGVEMDFDKAIDWLRKSCSREIWAAVEWYDIVESSNGAYECPKELIEALEFHSTGENANPAAMRRLGNAYRYGRGVEMDLDKAIDWFRKSYLESVWAAVEWYDIVESSDGAYECPKELIEALEFYSTGEEINYSAMRRLGNAYHFGRGVERDLDKAIDCFKGTYLESVWAAVEWYDIIESSNGAYECPKELMRAIKNYSKGKGANPAAMRRLGNAYRCGTGVERNLNKAIEWLRKSCSSEVWAAVEWYDIVESSNGAYECPKELIEALEFHSTGENANPAAMRRLGNAYYCGIGVDQDLDKAIEWLRKSCSSEVWAAVEWYDIVESSNGAYECPKELIEALEFHSTDENINAEAMRRLGNAYRYGRGVEKDLDKAIEWFRKSYLESVWAAIEWYDIVESSDGAYDCPQELIKALENYSKGKGANPEAMRRLENAY